MDMQTAGLIMSALMILSFYVGRAVGRMHLQMAVVQAEVELLSQRNVRPSSKTSESKGGNMKYEVQIDQVVSEVVFVDADSENDAMNKAGDELYQSNDSSFDGMPEYKFSVRKMVDTKEINNESK